MYLVFWYLNSCIFILVILINSNFMKTLNDNWFAITIVAVVFGLLGYLIGAQNNSKNCPMMSKCPMMQHNNSHKMMMWHHGAGSIHEKDIQVEIDSFVKDGEKQIKVMVKKEMN